LVTNILRNARLISKLADRVDKKSISPKFSSPKFGFHFGVFSENFLGGDAFQSRDQRSRTHPGNTLNQKMNMIFVRSNLQKVNIVALLNLKTDLLQRLINCFAENNSAVLGWTNKMVQQYRYIMRFMYVFAFAHTYKDINTPQAAGN
jgi:hypothetical protein